MPRRRPPGAGPGLSTTLLALFLVLPWISTAAQQQQPPSSGYRRSPREEAHVDTIAPEKPTQHHVDVEIPSRRSRYAEIVSQNERAIATRPSSSAPGAPRASVRAPSARDAAASGGLSSSHSARSLQEWEVEEFVLLATVDGHLHARRRDNGAPLWDFDVGKPMVETIYHHKNNSNADDGPESDPFLWIVEPSENGNLYILTLGPQPSLMDLRLSIRQLTDELAPYHTDDPAPISYTTSKNTIMYVLDAQSGHIKKEFRAGNPDINTESCEPRVTGFASSPQLQCRGTFNIGRTEYTVAVSNSRTGKILQTIKYSEWTPNNRDRDLHSQYLSTFDNKYVYAKYDGEVIGIDHSGSKNMFLRRPIYKERLPAPVVRVFDVARHVDDNDPEPALVVLPQPIGPAVLDEGMSEVWLNTTEAGSWYAMSERRYPSVTDGAQEAHCYSAQWHEVMQYAANHVVPDRLSLVGVHSLDRTPIPSKLAIAGPTKELISIPTVPIPRDIDPEPEGPEGPPKSQTVTTRRTWIITVVALIAAAVSLGFAIPIGLNFLRNRVPVRVPSVEPTNPTPPLPAQAGTDALEPEPLPAADVAPPAPEKVVVDAPEAKERRVKFDIPDDDEEDLEPLSRATTIDGTLDDANGIPTEAAQAGENAEDGTQADGPATPKKKKTHRGKRGTGRKKREQREQSQTNKVVNAVKQLEEGPSLLPDEETTEGDDVQDVSNMKKIGKITIDSDRVLGNGSGGTFVFEGKWNERDVAVKRMLPQYFGLAEQEVKLLQESDLHPNVIRYFDDERDENFLYIAVELCQASLWDLYRDGRPEGDLTDVQQRLINEINMDVPRALYQLALGVNHLHGLRIIHRDIKPQNILIAYPQRNQKNGPRLVISDFGLCKTLPDNASTLVGTTGNAGTVGWKAPELIVQPSLGERGSSTGHSRDSSSSTDPVAQGVKRAVDIFSLGCVFFYVLTNGCHPFDDDEGWMQVRELNIKKNKPNFSRLNLGDDSEEPIHLISWMLANRPEERPTALQVMNHPFFWPAEKRLNFLCDCSDHWEREPRDPPSEHLSILEDYSYKVLDKKRNFIAKLDHAFVASLGKQRKYTGDRMLDLLRALRNKKNHYEDMDESVKAKVGPLPHGYLRYWTTKFPTLVMSCYECVVECGLQNEPRFRPYFETQTV